MSKLKEFSLKGLIIPDYVPVIEDIVLIFRDYRWTLPYIKFLLSPDYNTSKATVSYFKNNFLPGGDTYLERIIRHTPDEQIRKLAIKNLRILDIWEDIKKIKTKKKFFVESALGSIQNRMSLSYPLTLEMFRIEVKRLGWNLKGATEKELEQKFSVLLAPSVDENELLARSVTWNLEAIKEIISLTS